MVLWAVSMIIWVITTVVGFWLVTMVLGCSWVVTRVGGVWLDTSVFGGYYGISRVFWVVTKVFWAVITPSNC